MKLNTNKSHISTSGSLDTQQATIELNSTTIHVLSRDLYSRPIEAVLREILTNAIDSHIESNQKKPVHIKLPTSFDERFYIRDFGCGLDHETLKGIYLAYGKSTRRESDEAHGGFGLGTKSPLAYTTAFSVTSYKDGIKNDYLVYYDEDNLPCLDHRESNKTSEENGLLVSFSAVSARDYLNFRQAAEKILPRIPATLYKLVDSEVESWIPQNGFTLPQGMSYGPIVFRPTDKPEINVVMGCVAYSLDHEAVINVLMSLQGDKSKITIDNQFITSHSLIQTMLRFVSIEINASIGDYPIHPSREYINVTPRAVKKFIGHLQQGLDAIATTWLTSDSTLQSDVMQYRIINKVNVHRAQNKLRARFIAPSERYYSSPILSKQLNTYAELVAAVASYSGEIVVAELSADDMTDYLGNRRDRYAFPSGFPEKTGILFVDKSRKPDWFDDITATLRSTFDFSDAIFAYSVTQTKIKQREQQAVQAKADAWASRKITRSMQDPTHNVLMFNHNGNGTVKRSWSSGKHNVTTLKALKRPIFYVATRMGCIADKALIPIIERFNSLYLFIPTYKRPIIIGLPASKGTLTIEREFMPLQELSNYLDEFLASPYAQRRTNFKQLLAYLAGAVKLSDIDIYSDYGPADMLRRIYQLSNKYHINDAPYLDINTDEDSYAPKVKSLVQDVVTKFPLLNCNRAYWYSTNDKLATQMTAWAQEIAALLNSFPTSAKYKNRKDIELNTEENS